MTKDKQLSAEGECQLDKEWFVCSECKMKFRHTEGTWIPIGELIPEPIVILSEPNEMPLLLRLWQTPEIITSDEFTCYNCL